MPRSVRPSRSMSASVMSFTLVLAAAAVQSATPDASRVHMVRVPHQHLADAPQDHVDPCAFDPQGAVLFLSDVELTALTVPHERLGTLADHLRRFRPARTMQAVGVPSIAKALGEPVVAPQGPPLAAGTTQLEYDRYHTPQEGIDFYYSLAAAAPDIARIVVLGQSVEGRDIIALKLTDNPDVAEPEEQRTLICALHHAREWATHESMLYNAEYLVTQYPTNLRVQNIINNSEVWLVLCVNPDGFQYSWDENRMWRKNRRDNGGGSFGVDLNRNYDYEWGSFWGGSSGVKWSETYRGPSAASEPETQGMQTLLADTKPVVAVTYHTYSQLVLYPWGYTGRDTAESYTSMRAIADNYARLVDQTYGFDYVPGPGNYTIYTTNGDFTDYAYGAQGVIAYTPEQRPAASDLGGFLLPEEQILPNNKENLAAALWIMDNAANARTVTAPVDLFSEGTNAFSLPLTTVNQKPELALGMDEITTPFLSAWLDDELHQPPGFGAYPDNYEGVGAASAYHFEYTEDSAAWADAFTGYTAVPHTFENGAVVMIENFDVNGTNYVGIPSEAPVRMTDIILYRRIVDELPNDFGIREIVLRARTPIEDLEAPDPWISWTWTWTDADGVVHTSHPLGEGGADIFVHPFRAYQFTCFNESYKFDSEAPSEPVYLLRFPPPLRADTDGDDDLDLVDYASFQGCMTGPVQTQLTPPCNGFDLDHDYDVDGQDFSTVQRLFTGS